MYVCCRRSVSHKCFGNHPYLFICYFKGKRFQMVPQPSQVYLMPKSWVVSFFPFLIVDVADVMRMG